MAGKTTPRERLAALLKQGSSIPELKDFRNQCRDVFRLGGVMGLDHWLEARRNLKLLPTRQVERAADDLEAVLGRVIDEATMKPAPAPRPSLTWEQRVELINTRETIRRNAKPKPPPHRLPNRGRRTTKNQAQRDYL